MSDPIKIRLHRGLRNKIEKLLNGEVVSAISADPYYHSHVDLETDDCDAIVHYGMNESNTVVTEGVIWVKPAELEESACKDACEPDCEDDAIDEPLTPESEDSLVEDED